MKAVIFGGGNIGRGFIGLIFRQSGYEVTFIDVAEAVVSGLNERHSYPVRIISNSGHDEIIVDGVNAISAENGGEVSDAIANADIMATAVGVNVLKHIVPNLARGIRKRFETTEKPLNIIICENLLGADKYLASLIEECFSSEEYALFNERIGLVEASIGRMVPVQTEEMKAGDPLRVCVEQYGFLPVDKEAFKGSIPDIKGMFPYSPFEYYIRRKLFVHNMGHSICAYLGMFVGQKYIYEAIDDPEILIIVKNAMLESAQALSMEYDISFLPLLSHIDDLLFRFTNKALGDTCARVGADTIRKLGSSDRLVGAARLCEKQKIPIRYIPIGIAAAVFRHLHDEGKPQTEESAAKVLKTICGLAADDPLTAQVIYLYRAFADGTSPRQLRIAAQSDDLRGCSDIV